MFSFSHSNADICHADGVNRSLIHRVANEAMQTPQLLLDRIGEAPEAAPAAKRLVVVMRQLGDFDAMKYARLVAS